MALLSINPKKSNKLFFEYSITGSNENPTDIRFVIGNYFICEGFAKDNQIQINIPPIDHIFESGLYDCYLEIIIENTLFIPFTEKIKISNSLQNENTEIKIKKNSKSNYVFDGFLNPFRS